MSKAQALLACAAIGAVAVVGTLAAGVSRQNASPSISTTVSTPT